MNYSTDAIAQIRARLVADAVLAGYVSTRIAYFTLPADTVYPSITFNVVSETNQDAFQTRVVELVFDVHIWVEEMPQSNAYIGYERARQIALRVAGDWDQQASRVPSYGLARWQPTAGNGFNYTLIVGEQEVDQTEPGLIHLIQTYSVFMSRVAV